MSAITAVHLLTGPDEDFGPRADGLVTLHTFENADPRKNTLRDAIAGAIWQDRADVLGSYGRIIAVDGVLLTVPDDHASGGINPASAYWKPAAWLYKFFSREVIANPNYFTLNLCAMGQAAWYEANGWPSGIIDGFARSIIDEERRIGRSVVVTNHLDFQTNRSDAGAKCIQLVMKRYEELTAAPAPVVVTPPSQEIIVDFAASTRQIPKIVRIRGGATLYRQPMGDEVHWQVPADAAFDAELLLGNANRFLCRRVGQGSAWWCGLDAIDSSVPYRLLTEQAPVVDNSAEVAELADRLANVKAKAAAFAEDVQDD